MSTNTPNYQGDEQLNRLLSAAGIGQNVEDVRVFLEGVVAAPASEDPDEWMTLLSASPIEATLSAQLSQLKAQLGAAAAERAASDPPLAERVVCLRAELSRRGLSGFIVPRADKHQGEYVPKRAARLEWLTGFSGSAGVAVVLSERAVIFVDGRYTLQVQQEVDGELFEYAHLVEAPLAGWLELNLKAGDVLGYDPWLHTRDGVRKLQRAAKLTGARLEAVSDNVLDAVWANQPPPPLSPVRSQPEAFSGEASATKRRSIASEMKGDAVVLTAPDSIAWLLNMRGGDLPFTPFALGFAILHRDATVDLFIDARKLTAEVRAHFGDDVRLSPPDALAGVLDRLGEASASVQLDGGSAASWLFDRLHAANARIISATDPCSLPKACKNEVERSGSRAAHLRDGVAITRFLRWVEENGLSGALDEIKAASKLLELRRENKYFRDLSFPSISGMGPNGAIVHYRVNEASCRPFEANSLYLIDSGGQYLDGTTDITRTVAVGTPSAEMRERFTLVLKGHIALARAVFPPGTSGSQLDVLARSPLWRAGLDYDHGTGHGVGSYLSVHEGPQRISKAPNSVALKPGMIISNEPGYYKADEYGIRIENLVLVAHAEPAEGAERAMLAFETLTLAPIDHRLVVVELLEDAERRWFNDYHARVLEALAPLLDADTSQWLADACRPL